MNAKAGSSSLRNIVARITIGFDGFEAVQSALGQWWRAAKAGAKLCAMVIGETGTGKSTALEAFASEHPRARNTHGVLCPVLSAIVPSKPTRSALVQQLLTDLGDPAPHRGSVNSRTDRLLKLLCKTDVRMVLLDDLHHFVDKRQDIALYEASDYLNELVVRSNIALVGFGLPDAVKVLESNEQLQTRHSDPVVLRRFNWMDECSQDQFVAVLNGFQEHLDAFELPQLGSPEISLRMYLASGGLIRYVARILEQAIWNALDRRLRTISLADLAHARAQAVWTRGKNDFNPLSAEHDIEQLAERVQDAMKLGARVERPRPRDRDRPPQRELADVGL